MSGNIINQPLFMPASRELNNEVGEQREQPVVPVEKEKIEWRVESQTWMMDRLADAAGERLFIEVDRRKQSSRYIPGNWASLPLNQPVGLGTPALRSQLPQPVHAWSHPFHPVAMETQVMIRDRVERYVTEKKIKL